MKYKGASWNFRRGTVGIKAMGSSSSSMMAVMVVILGEGAESPYEARRFVVRTGPGLIISRVLAVEEVREAQLTLTDGYFASDEELKLLKESHVSGRSEDKVLIIPPTIPNT